MCICKRQRIRVEKALGVQEIRSKTDALSLHIQGTYIFNPIFIGQLRNLEWFYQYPACLILCAIEKADTYYYTYSSLDVFAS